MTEESSGTPRSADSHVARSAVIVVPVNDVARMVALCRVVGLTGTVVPVRSVGCVVVLGSDSGLRRPVARLSRLVRGADVLLVERSGDVHVGRAWRRGAEAAADVEVLLASWPAAVRDLLSGSLDPFEVAGVGIGQGSRPRALTTLLRAPRRWS